MSISRQFIRRREQLCRLLDQGSEIDGLNAALSWTIVGLIVATLAATVLESVPRLAVAYSEIFSSVEYLALSVFSFEYVARLWTAPDCPPWRRLGAIRSRLHFATSPTGLVDLLAVLPSWVSLFVASDLKVFLVLRLWRFFKLTRYSPAMASLLDALYAERRALAGCSVILCGATLMAAALMHFAEGSIQPDKFGTIPDAMWWAIVTLGTVGYGDAVPVTAAGRLVASVTIFAGLLMVALPVGIVATAFANEVHRRDFVVTWGQVARIPLFSELSAAQIADVMKLLRAQKLEKGSVITRRGDPAHSMYLIVDGEVEIKLRHRHVRLGAGDFFGEIAALRQSRRSATAVATMTTRLLALDASDLHGLMDREPQIASRISDAARVRLGEAAEANGDLAAAELTA